MDWAQRITFVKRYVHDIEIALESLMANKLKSGLTALGILFGVAAVISMLAIGQGAKQEILDQMELIGASNIIVEARVKQSAQQGESSESEDQQSSQNKKSRFSPGLNLEDVKAVGNIVPNLRRVSPEIILESAIVHRDRSFEGQCIGVDPDYFDIYHLDLARGNHFSPLHQKSGKRVCLIGAEVGAQLFSQQNPIGRYLKFGGVWLKVIGVLQREQISSTTINEYGFNNVNASIYIPAKTLILRLMNRKLIHFRPSKGRRGNFTGHRGIDLTPSSQDHNNYHQLDRLILKVSGTDQLTPTARLVERMIKRRHNGMMDFQVIVPQKLIQQKQETKEIFNFVLGAIAGISLLVGGIGIMNIMFATVMERIREIGIRMAVGAKKKDVLMQFLTEAVLISLAGGVAGIGLGVGLSQMIEQLAGIQTLVTPGSVLLAFLVSASVGVAFGYSPARRAASKDPIESLRHE